MTREFLKHIWPSQGFYCIATPVKGDKGFYYHQTLYTNIEEASKAAEAIDASGKDCYMAVGTLKERSYICKKTGKKKVRGHENMGWFKTLIFDIDCGEDQPYKTQKEALVHLKEFCKKIRLPKPTLVNSGGGLHVYFTFEEEVTADRWHDIALKLRAVAKDFGLGVDTKRTCDRSSVLRVADTHNHKKGLERPVEIMQWGTPERSKLIDGRLTKVVKDKGLKINNPRKFKSRVNPNKDFEVPDSLKNAFGNVKPTIYENCDGKLIFEGCNVMGKVLELKGRVPEPMWYHTLQCDRLSDHPIPYEISNGHPDYVEAEMLAKLSQLEQNKVGATTCETFQDAISSYPDHKHLCDNCVHKGKIRSPRELGTSLKSLAPPNSAENSVEVVLATKAEVKPKAIENVEVDYDASSAFGGTEVKSEKLEFPMEPEEKPEKKVLNSESKESHAPKTLETDFGFDVSFPAAPYPYTRGYDGVYVTVEDQDEDYDYGGGEDEDGEHSSRSSRDQTQILGFDLFPTGLRAEKVGGNFTVLMEARIPNETTGRKLEIPFTEVVDDRSLKAALAGIGVIADSNWCFEMIKDYMTKYIKEIQRLVKTVQKYSQLGWHEDGDIFILPTETLLKDGTKEDSGVDKSLVHSVGSFRKKGTLEEWKKIIDAYSLPGYEPYAFGHLSGYGSLLFRFTDYEGAIVSVVGGSGSGKSTVLKTINSIFGHPVEPMLIQSDTNLARMNRLGVFNSICVTYDEITNIREEDLSDWCYSITQGRGKHRLNQNAEAKENTTTWQMILVSSSNEPLMGKLSNLKHNASAESLRVFEYRIDPMDVMTKQEASVFDNLKHNFGHAGEIFVNYVVQHPEEVQKLISQYQLRFDEAANIPITERYWSAITACTLAGGEIANKLGLGNFDIESLFSWATRQVSNMRNIVNDNYSDPVILLNEFLNQSQMAMIVVSDSQVTKGSIYVEREPRTSLVVRADITNQKAYISKSAFKTWLAKGSSDYHLVKTELKNSGILLDDNKSMTLSKGSKLFPSGQVRCWLVDLDHPEMNRSIDLVSSESKPAEIIKMAGIDKDETG